MPPESDEMEISVVIPCHNAEPYLAQTLKSVLRQTRPPTELIVVEDSSTDESAAIARSFGDPVRLESVTFRNAAATRNYGARLASGDALMFMDADDVLGPEVLAALGDELERHSGSIAAGPWYRLELHGDRWVRRPSSCPPRRPGQDPLDAWLRGWYHPPCSVLWSRGAYEQAGEWDPRSTANDDGEIMMRALSRGVPLRLVTRGESFYRRRPEGEGSLSGTRLREDGLRSRLYVIEKIARLLEGAGKLGRYRSGVGHAFSQILWDAEGRFPEIAEMSRVARRRYGDPMAIRVVHNLYSKVRRALIRERSKPGAPRPEEEV
jgi:O-antigen biosynthesis protein